MEEICDFCPVHALCVSIFSGLLGILCALGRHVVCYVLLCLGDLVRGVWWVWSVHIMRLYSVILHGVRLLYGNFVFVVFPFLVGVAGIRKMLSGGA